MPIKPKFDKVTRFASTISIFQSGQVLLPSTSSYNRELIREITSFPNTKNDDIVDSISQFLNFMKSVNNMQARVRKL